MRPEITEHRQAIVVAGSGRSGTTWIASVLAACRDAMPTFEPLNSRRVSGVPVPAGFPDCPGVYLRPESDDAAWLAFFRKLLDTDVRCCWTRQDWTQTPRIARFLPLGSRVSSYAARKRYDRRAARARFHVIKMIRANLLLGWLVRRFPVRLIFVIRHPCAVVASRLQHRWSDALDGILSQPALMADYLQPMHECIARADSDVERLAVLWCVENLVPLRQRILPPTTTCWYESFDKAPEQAFGGLFSALQLEPTTAAEQAMRRVCSNATVAARRGPRPWHAGLGSDHGRRVLDICHAFGLPLYGASLEPLEQSVSALAHLSQSADVVAP